MCLLSFVGASDILYWQITDAATVDGGSIYSFVESYGTYEEELEDGSQYIGYNIGARVKITGGNLTEPYYLPQYIGDGNFADGRSGVEFSPNLGGHWGCGVPVGNQSSIESLQNNEMFMEYIFVIELGEYTWDDALDSWNLIPLAESDKYVANQLQQYFYERFDLGPPETGIWTPIQFHSTPEPTTGMLIILGLSYLLLKRRCV